MKQLIKLYQTPKVDLEILSFALSKRKKQENKYIILLNMIFVWIFILFLSSLYDITISYFDIFLWLSFNLSFIFSFFVNIIVWIIYFIVQNFLLIWILWIFVYLIILSLGIKRNEITIKS